MMRGPRRLFLFAAYDPQGVVSDALLWDVRKLSACGDVVLAMDSDCPDAELSKLSGLVLHCEAKRHGEYDFGSYKRCFAWAEANLSLESYDFCYMVNDSVYGPLADILPVLEDMESLSVPAFSLVIHPDVRLPHLQSWFVGMTGRVFLSGWFASFILSVRRQARKEDVCLLYETGFCELLRSKEILYRGLYSVGGKGIYDRVLSVYRKGVPFVKKAAFIRHNGSAGWQLGRLLASISPQLRGIITADASRLYGRGYVDALLSSTPLQSFWRLVVYSLRKCRKKAR